MKKIYNLFFGTFLLAVVSAGSFAQQINMHKVDFNQKPIVKEVPAFQLPRASQVAAGTPSRWFNMGETLDLWVKDTYANSDSSSLVENYLFPDSTILAEFGTGTYDNPFVHNISDIFWPKSEKFYGSYHSGELILDSTSVFNVDTIAVVYDYLRMNNLSVDTLIVEARVNPTGSVFYFPGESANFGVDTVRFLGLKYKSSTNSLDYTGKTSIKIVLDASKAGDTLSNGLREAILPVNFTGMGLDAAHTSNNYVVTSVRFVPGYTHVMTDTLNRKNNALFLSWKEQQGDTYPKYVSGEYGCSYIASTTVRYDLSPGTSGWNGYYLPSVAYTAPYAFEHHDIYYHVTSTSGNEKYVGINKPKETSKDVILYQNSPNPFNNQTNISYDLKNNTSVSLVITDIMGREVKQLNQGTQAAGRHSVSLNCSEFSNGIYFYTLKTGATSITKKMIISE